MTRRGYETFEHTADIGIRAWAAKLPDLFEEAGKALFSVIAELDNVAPAKTIQIELQAESEEELLLKWLKELLFIFDTERLLLSQFKVVELTLSPKTGTSGPVIASEAPQTGSRMGKQSKSAEIASGAFPYGTPSGARPRNDKGGKRLKTQASGEPLNPAKHRLYREVKAITRHQFKLIREHSRFLAEVILDI